MDISPHFILSNRQAVTILCAHLVYADIYLLDGYHFYGKSSFMLTERQ